MTLETRRLQHRDEVDFCARLMSSSEPWITLRRSFDDSVKILTDPAREVYLAILDGRIAGFLILAMQGPFRGYIQTICVAPGWRSKGLGRKLIEFAEARIFSETPNVFMCVSSFNTRARALYERLGYQVVGELQDYIVRGHSEVLLRKTIAPLTEFRPPPPRR